jgi:uncharacterized protein (TIGR03066 family)
MRSLMPILLVALFFAGLAWADSRPSYVNDSTSPTNLGTLIIGKWEPIDEKQKGSTIEFTAAGNLVILVKDLPQGLKIGGTYKIIGDEEFEASISFQMPGMPKPETKTEKVNAKIINDQLITTDKDNKVEKMKRVK